MAASPAGATARIDSGIASLLAAARPDANWFGEGGGGGGGGGAAGGVGVTFGGARGGNVVNYASGTENIKVRASKSSASYSNAAAVRK